MDSYKPELSPLEKRVKEGSLPSTILLTGAKERINLAFVKEFAKQLLGPTHHCKIDSGNHPDLHFYLPEEKSGLHSLSTIRSLLQEVGLPPFESPYKLFVIEKAEKMLPSSSNSLLKTLEEPPQDTIILLLSERPDALLPTLRSRCTCFSYFDSSTGPSLALFDSLLALAANKEYAELLELLDRSQEELAKYAIIELLEPLFAKAAHCYPYKKIASLMENLYLASQYNMKQRTLLSHFFLSL